MNKTKKLLFIFGVVLFCSINFAFGQITFQKTYGGIAGGVGYSVEQTTDGGYIIVGSSYSASGVAPDIFLVKTNSNGDSVWTKTYGGADIDEANCVHQTFDGGYIICGSTFSFGVGNSDVYLIRTDSVGDTLWTKTYGGLY